MKSLKNGSFWCPLRKRWDLALLVAQGLGPDEIGGVTLRLIIWHAIALGHNPVYGGIKTQRYTNTHPL